LDCFFHVFSKIDIARLRKITIGLCRYLS
jgi:hypothetical protein